MSLIKVSENMTSESASNKYEFDIVLSFAGEDRNLVEQIADYLTFFGMRVFYDEWEKYKLIGKDLYTHLADVYQKRAKYCAMFISEYYVKKAWPKHERRFAQARAFIADAEYILPILIDDTECPGIPPTVGYLDSRKTTPSQIAVILLKKLGAELYKGDAYELVLSRYVRWKIDWDGSVDAHGKYSVLYVGRGEKEKLTFNVWSPSENPLIVEDLQACDGKGNLCTKIIGKTETSCEFAVYSRKPLRFGETLDYEVCYRCVKYYKDVTKICKDNFTASLPIKVWNYEFVFPQHSIIKVFHIVRSIDDQEYRQSYSTSIKDGHPIIFYSLKSPKPGSNLKIEFKLSRSK